MCAMSSFGPRITRIHVLLIIVILIPWSQVDGSESADIGVCPPDQCLEPVDRPALVYPNDVVRLTQELVSIPSVTGTENDAGRYIAEWLTRRGWNVSLQPVQPDGSYESFNVVALPPNVDLSQVKVVLSSHFDTVPVNQESKIPSSEIRLYGRGAVDAKGIVAALMVAADSLREQNILDIALLFVCREETDHAGMRTANGIGFSENITLVNGEPTEGRLCTYQKGILKVEVVVQGLSCHSGYPERGISAIDTLIDVLLRFRTHTWPSDSATGANTTFNVGLIAGGTAGNVVPSSATATVLFRLISEAEEVLASIRTIIAEFENVTVRGLGHNSPLRMYAPPHAAANFGTYIASYNTDLSYFKNAAKKVLFGGGTILNAHTDDEYIEVEDLKIMPSQYMTIVQELLSETSL